MSAVGRPGRPLDSFVQAGSAQLRRRRARVTAPSRRARCRSGGTVDGASLRRRRRPDVLWAAVGRADPPARAPSLSLSLSRLWERVRHFLCVPTSRRRSGTKRSPSRHGAFIAAAFRCPPAGALPPPRRQGQGWVRSSTRRHRVDESVTMHPYVRTGKTDGFDVGYKTGSLRQLECR